MPRYQILDRDRNHVGYYNGTLFEARKFIEGKGWIIKIPTGDVSTSLIRGNSVERKRPDYNLAIKYRTKL